MTGRSRTKRIALAVSAIGLFALLAACQKAPPINEDTSALENPPPRPPNCPKSSELPNLTLKNETIADVRIVKFLNTKLYFPTDMIGRELIDRKRDSRGLLQKGDLSQFYPDIYSVECPGTIHVFVNETPGDRRFTPMITVEFRGSDENPDPIKNIKEVGYSSKNETYMLNFTANVKPAGSRLRVAPYLTMP